MSLHLQFVEEAEAWRREQATASRMDMFAPDELFPTREAAEERMAEMTTTGGLYGSAAAKP